MKDEQQLDLIFCSLLQKKNCPKLPNLKINTKRFHLKILSKTHRVKTINKKIKLIYIFSSYKLPRESRRRWPFFVQAIFENANKLKEILKLFFISKMKQTSKSNLFVLGAFSCLLNHYNKTNARRDKRTKKWQTDVVIFIFILWGGGYILEVIVNH